MGGLVVIIILVLIVALVQQQRFHRDKKRFREADRYEADLQNLPYMGNIEPRAPTETTSLCPRIIEGNYQNDIDLPGMIPDQIPYFWSSGQIG